MTTGEEVLLHGTWSVKGSINSFNNEAYRQPKLMVVICSNL